MEDVRSLRVSDSVATIAPHGKVNVFGFTYVIEITLTLTRTIIDMKRFYKKVFRSKRPSLGSIHRPDEPATSTSTLITGTADLMPSIPTSDATATTQVTAGVIVSVQLRPLLI